MISPTENKTYIAENMTAPFNPDKQHTIRTEASISGTGLHTGILVDLTLKPATPGFGIQFQRIDLPGKPIIKADCDLVTDTSRGTTLEANGGKVCTVEHVLAALVGMGVDNCLLEVNAAEMPIMDGSSEPFVDLIERAGIAEQDAAKTWYNIVEIAFTFHFYLFFIEDLLQSFHFHETNRFVDNDDCIIQITAFDQVIIQ